MYQFNSRTVASNWTVGFEKQYKCQAVVKKIAWKGISWVWEWKREFNGKESKQK